MVDKNYESFHPHLSLAHKTGVDHSNMSDGIGMVVMFSELNKHEHVK